MGRDGRVRTLPLMPASLALIPVGVGAAYAAPGEAQSCYLIRAGPRVVCCDLGSGALNRLTGIVAPEELAAVVISHLHPDHCVDLLSLHVYMAHGPGRGRRLALHAAAGIADRFAAFDAGDWRESFDLVPLTAPAGRVDLGDGLVMTYVEVPHLAPTFALRFDRGGKSVCYGADCAPNDAIVELARGAGVLLLEASFGPEQGPAEVPHLSGAQAGRIAARAGAGRLVLTHCYPEFDRPATLAAARAAFAGVVEWARPGREVAA